MTTNSLGTKQLDPLKQRVELTINRKIAFLAPQDLLLKIVTVSVVVKTYNPSFQEAEPGGLQ